jgi:peroxiredoxin
LWHQRDQLQQLGVETKIVTFDAHSLAIAYIREMAISWPLLLDPDLSVYKAYGMQRGDVWALFGLYSIWKYLRLIFRGRLPGKAGKDWMQLGGDVLIDPQGIIRLHYVSRNPHDRPDLAAILKTVSDA